MTDHSDPKTRADGSLDTAHYLARGRELRSLAFWSLLGKLRPQRYPRPRAATPPARPHPVSAVPPRVTAPIG